MVRTVKGEPSHSYLVLQRTPRDRPQWFTVAPVEDFNAETDEDNGYAKPAGPMWRYLGGLIGLVVGLSLFWFLVSHH